MYEKNDSIQLFDAGTASKQIYSQRLGKWVVLANSGDTNGKNSTETSEEILNLIETLYNKYLNDEN